MSTYNYGCLPPKKDIRDFKLKSKRAMALQFPTRFELKHPRIKSQGNVGSCVAHASSSALEYFADGDELSTQFIYGLKRKILGKSYVGMFLADACKIIQKYGDALEEDCPGNTEVPDCFPDAENCLKDKEKAAKAYKYRIDRYYSCLNNNDVKYGLMRYGPVIASIKWYDQYKVDRNTGIIQFDTSSDFSYHCILIYGWDETGWKIQNSWGTSFGKQGVFILPWEYKLTEAKIMIDHPDKDDGALVEPKVPNCVAKVVNAVLNIFHKP